jgi:hypothetical protein
LTPLYLYIHLSLMISDYEIGLVLNSQSIVLNSDALFARKVNDLPDSLSVTCGQMTSPPAVISSLDVNYRYK